MLQNCIVSVQAIGLGKRNIALKITLCYLVGTHML